MVPGETAHEGNATDAANRTAGPSQLQAPYKVKLQAQNLGLQGLKERWDRKMVIIYGIPKFDWFLETSKTEKLVKKSDKT